ncbi:MAG TPA: hypothetical protein PLT55_04745 [Acidimicrobiia bacterium]|nr:hypothetical protein [Acidimicrobiia bacterium]
MFRSSLKLRISSTESSERGFATAEWLAIMAFTIFILAGLVQVLYVENVRATTISTLRDSAKVGAREADLATVFGTGSLAEGNVISQCEERIRITLSQVSRADSNGSSCVISFEDVNGVRRYFVEASVGPDYKIATLLPDAQISNNRISNLKARYYPTENAR